MFCKALVLNLNILDVFAAIYKINTQRQHDFNRAGFSHQWRLYNAVFHQHLTVHIFATGCFYLDLLSTIIDTVNTREAEVFIILKGNENWSLQIIIFNIYTCIYSFTQLGNYIFFKALFKNLHSNFRVEFAI